MDFLLPGLVHKPGPFPSPGWRSPLINEHCCFALMSPLPRLAGGRCEPSALLDKNLHVWKTLVEQQLCPIPSWELGGGGNGHSPPSVVP